MTNANESRRKQMEKEAAQEFVNSQAHQTLLVVVCGIPPAEGDRNVVEGDQSMVRDCDPMGVVAEIAQRVIGTPERGLRINDPVVAKQLTRPGGECFRENF